LCQSIRHLGSEISRNGNRQALPVFEIARVLVRVDHLASCIVWLGEVGSSLSFVVRQFVRMHTDIVGLGIAGKLDRFNGGSS
jgi:hypothetical protein